MKIQLIRIHEDGKQKPIRIFSHSEEIIIQRTRVKVMDRDTGKVNAMYVLEGLGPTGWMTIETTGNQELFAYIYVGDESTNENDKSDMVP
ncbi:MAG: hypothetical protein OES15_01120 [Nitrosopumilus sp.]|nr:hypothetical protein [Nitrosopumilus sp.]MDH3852864.1 hypothetical protein [Nitrosopumilus sp.]